MAGMRRKSGGGETRIPVSTTPSLPRKNPIHRSTQSLFGNRYEDDTDSVRSFGSAASSSCEHAHFARNGTTYSGRSNKYVVHCSSSFTSPHEYLTPTQRANVTIRHLKSLLTESRTELEEKEKEIARLTKKVVELRLQKAESSIPDEGIEPIEHPRTLLVNGHPPLVEERTIQLTTEVSFHDGPSAIIHHGGGSPLGVSTSLSDSGHFEELSPHPSPRISNSVLEREIEKLKHQHEEEVKVLKESTKVKTDTLIQRLTEATDRFCELKPQLEAFQKRVEELEDEKEELLKKCKESEEKHKAVYLQMFNKGQQAALFQHSDAITIDGEPVMTLPELLKQLEVTKQELESVKDTEYWRRANMLSGREALSLWNMCRKTMYRKLIENKKSKSEQDAEVTLQFLKSAVYYFLTDKENANGHLSAIQSILGFGPEERAAIERATLWK